MTERGYHRRGQPELERGIDLPSAVVKVGLWFHGARFAASSCDELEDPSMLPLYQARE